MDPDGISADVTSPPSAAAAPRTYFITRRRCFSQRPASCDCGEDETHPDGFVILASHVISTLHRQHPPPPPPTTSHPPPGLQSSADRHRETLLPQKQRSVYFVVTFFDSQDQSGERKKEKEPGRWRIGWWWWWWGGTRPATQTSFVWAKTRRRLCSGF